MPAPDATRRRLVAAALALAVVGALLALLPAPAPGRAVAATSMVVADSGPEALAARRAAPRPQLPALLVVAAFPLAWSLVRHRRAVRVRHPGQRRHFDVWIPERAPPAAS